MGNRSDPIDGLVLASIPARLPLRSGDWATGRQGRPRIQADKHIWYGPRVRVFATELAESSINFKLDVWHEPDEPALRRTRDQVIEAVPEALVAADITIPFPQRTLWLGETQATGNGRRAR